MSSIWNGMTLDQRIRACHLDIMKHQDFALLASVVCIGDLLYDDPKMPVPTAATNGRDVFYNTKFCMAQNKKQLRYVVLHENFHKMLRHCLLFKEALKRDGQRANRAMDYVVNGLIEQCDPTYQFVERPSLVPVLVDKKYFDWSFPKVFNDLKSNGEDGPTRAPGGMPGEGDAMDGHIAADDMSPEEQRELEKQIEDAVQQGRLLCQALRGADGSGGPLDNKAVQRDTNWREHLRNFIESAMEGYDDENWSKPDVPIYSAIDVVMPTYITETIGEIVIAADTSGSMAGYYPLLFGEVAQIMRNVRPEKVTLIWWDTAVAGVQVFEPHEYDSIATALKPAGGGGTTPQVFVDYIAKNKLKPKAVIVLTDGYIGDEPKMDQPSLWGIVENESWVSKWGQTIHIPSNLRY